MKSEEMDEESKSGREEERNEWKRGMKSENR
jgi:hypothetical protein